MSSPPALTLEDYDAIAAAVMETERGRWFLSEFARRNRAADTAAVLEALAAVEARLSARNDAPASGAEEAARRITGALDAAARIRATLADADEAPAVRAFGDLRAVEADLKEALRALGAPQTAALAAIAAPKPEAAPPKAASPAPAKAETPAPAPASRPEAVPAKPAPVAASAPAVRARPLLDSLSEAEKAILFA